MFLSGIEAVNVCLYTERLGLLMRFRKNYSHRKLRILNVLVLVLFCREVVMIKATQAFTWGLLTSGLSPFLSYGKYGSMKAGIVLEKQLRAPHWMGKQQEERDTGPDLSI